jgi:hypothetical protein
MNENQIRDAIEQFYLENPNTELTAKQVGDKFKYFPIHGDRSAIIRGIKKYTLRKKVQKKEGIHEFQKKEDFSKGTLESTITISFEPKSVEALYLEHKIDPELYIIKNYWSKKTPAGKFTSSVFATKKTLLTAEPDDYLELLKDYRSFYKPLSKKDILVNDSFGRPTSLLLNITDFHLDKLDIFGTTIEEKKELFYKTVRRLLYRAYQSNYLDEITFILGSDMLHTDTYNNTTTRGTILDTNTTWDHAFTTAFDIYSTVINILKQFCNKLNVLLVQGNHDRTKSFYLAFGLQKFFEKEEGIVFDTSSSPRKVYTYGNTFIGFHHGDCKIMELPLLFAKEFTELWGKCKYHVVVVGDKHHLQVKEIQGVRVIQLPGLTEPDKWHNQENYINSIPAAIATVYDKEFGECMTIEERGLTNV